jgi:hypothetical protein
MKTVTATNRKFPKIEATYNFTDFYLASEIYRINKASKASNKPKLPQNDRRNPASKKKERLSPTAYIKQNVKFEFTFLKRGLQKVLSFAHIH